MEGAHPIVAIAVRTHHYLFWPAVGPTSRHYGNMIVQTHFRWLGECADLNGHEFESLLMPRPCP